MSSSAISKSSHHWWKTAKTACGLRERDVIPPLVVNGKVHISAHDKADYLNASFAVQCSARPSSSEPTAPPLVTATDFVFEPVSASAVLKRLSSLNVGKASGLDDIGNRLLRECAAALAGPLSHISTCLCKRAFTLVNGRKLLCNQFSSR